MYFCSFSVLSDAAESLQQFRKTVCYSGIQQRINKLRSQATNYICKEKSPRHTQQKARQAGNTPGWLPAEIFHPSIFHSPMAPISFFCQLIQHCRHQQQTNLGCAFISHMLFLEFSYFVILCLLIQRPQACHRMPQRGLCIQLQCEEKERTEVVSRPLVAVYLLQSDLQLWRDGSNDDGNSFSNYFSAGIATECVSPA